MTEASVAADVAAQPVAQDRILDLDGLQVFYGNIEALKGVSLHVMRGEIVTLIGSNGAGKSTTLRTISGLLRLAITPAC